MVIRSDRTFTWAMGGLLAIQALSFAALVAACAITVPYADIYSLITQAFAVRDGRQSLFAYLWTPHAGHYVPFARALVVWDMAALRGKGWPAIAVAVLALAGAAGLLAREAWRGAAPGLQAGAAVLAAMMTLTGIAAFDASQPVFGTFYPTALVFTVLALVLFASDRADARLAALAAGVAAGLCNAVGLCVLPAMMLLALTRRGPGRSAWIAGLAIIGGAFALAYLPLTHALTAPGAAATPWTRLGVVLSFLGLPLSQFAWPLGWLLATGLMGFALRPPWRLELRRERLALALAVFSLLAAGLAAFGRVDAALGVRAPIRYAPLVTPLQVAVLLRLIGGTVAPSLRVRWGMLGVAAALLVIQAASAGYAVKTVHTIRGALARHIAGDRSSAVQTLVFPDPAVADAVDARLRREGLFQ